MWTGTRYVPHSLELIEHPRDRTQSMWTGTRIVPHSWKLIERPRDRAQPMWTGTRICTSFTELIEHPCGWTQSICELEQGVYLIHRNRWNTFVIGSNYVEFHKISTSPPQALSKYLVQMLTDYFQIFSS